MTNGPIDRSGSSDHLNNPYKRGTARYRLWARREADKRKKNKPKPKTKKDTSKRRKHIDSYLEQAQTGKK